MSPELDWNWCDALLAAQGRTGCASNSERAIEANKLAADERYGKSALIAHGEDVLPTSMNALMLCVGSTSQVVREARTSLTIRSGILVARYI